MNRSLKKPLGLRLTEDAITFLRVLSNRTGLSQAGIVELAIREKASRDGVSLEDIQDAQDADEARSILANSDPTKRHTLAELKQAAGQ
jgi:hypothetical protein